MVKICLDYVDNICFDEDNPPFRNYSAFYSLHSGIQKLASEIRELEISQNNDRAPIFSLDITGDYRNDLLVCYFDWFSISITNYVRLVGLFDLMVKENWKSKDLQTNEKDVRKYCSDYVQRIIPEIRLWRNKMSAHFAATDPRNDNLGTIELTLFSFVTYVKPYYEVGGANWSTDGETSEFKRWSLTETYDNLTPRYWPMNKIPSLKLEIECIHPTNPS